MSSQSSGSSFQSSSGQPVVTPTPENSLLDQIAGYATQLAQQMNSWAQGEFAQTSQVTDQAVGNFFQAAQNMANFSSGLTSQYNNLFAPENKQLVDDANSYASPERMKADMGMAGATQAQAGDQAIKNSEAQLQSMGIDPSAGRYAALDKAAAVQNAANVAGAENTQQRADVATGQNLRSQAVQVGSLLPSAISNATNTAIQANTGASNASLANANTGANLMSLADKYLSTAMQLKLSPVGQKTASSGMSTQQSSSDKGGGGGGGSGSGSGSGFAPGTGPNGGQGSSWFNPANYTQGSGGGGGGGAGGRQPGAGIMQLPGSQSQQAPTDWPAEMAPIFDQQQGVQDAGETWAGPGWQNGSGEMGVGAAGTYDPINTDSGPWGGSGMGDTFGDDTANTFGNLGSTQNDMSGLGDITYDPSANQSQVPQDWQDPNTWDGGTSWDQPSSGGGDQSDPWSSGSGQDYSDYNTGFGNDYSDDSGYAAGGSVQPQGQPQGQPVPPQASPSGGQQTDDVRANLNAGEFVVPKDVARWKGEEFFHNLIAKSRQTRATSPLGGKPMPQGDPRAQGAPTFSTTGGQ